MSGFSFQSKKGLLRLGCRQTPLKKKKKKIEEEKKEKKKKVHWFY